MEDARVADYTGWLEGAGRPYNDTVGFFATVVNSPVEQDATLLLGFDDRLLVYLNGKEVFRTKRRGGGLQLDGDQAPVKLAKGPNLLIAKLFNGFGGSAVAVGVKASSADNAVTFSKPVANAAAPAGAAATSPAPAGEGQGIGQKSKDGQELPSLETLATLQGDAKRGAEVFKNTKGANCIACHQIANQGQQLGPPLDVIGAKLNKQQLYEAILFPSTGILMHYENWVVRTKKGDVVSGLLDTETPDQITIKDTAGKYHDIPVEDVDRKVQQKMSLMPEGLSGTMTKQELVDLVAYLSSLKPAS